MKAPASRVEAWIWVLIYGGLGLVSVGAALARAGRFFAWGVILAGGAAVVVGAALVWVRSRMTDPPDA